jgi:hypothetical protein
MASKKSSGKQDSPEKYIRTRARNLPLGECYINHDWADHGMAFIIVTRKHSTGNITFGSYQVDLYCLGVKDTFWDFNVLPGTIEHIKDQYREMTNGTVELGLTDYTLVHNIIYGAEAFADDLGFKPHKDFSLTQFILEEDDDSVDFIELDFGIEGLPAVIKGKEQHPAGVLKTLDRVVGKGNYFVLSEDGTIIDGPALGNEPDNDDDTQEPMNMEMVD